MSDKPISVGDLVVVVRTNHACADRLLGAVFTVEELPWPHNGVRCSVCGQRNVATPIEPVAAYRLRGERTPGNVPISWLKRIPPIEELDNVRQDEEIAA